MTRLRSSPPVDVAIIGAGPAGAALAIHLRKRGRSVAIVEKEQFPRYHIGEALTGECVALLDELDLSDHLARNGYKERCGAIVSGANARAQFWVPVQAVVNGERVESTTWHVRRDEFDKALFDRAIALGAESIRGTCRDVVRADGRVSGVTVDTDDGECVAVEARYVADCSGQATFLASKGVIGPRDRTGYENQTALYAQVKGMLRDAPPKDTRTQIFYGKKHHWAWAMPLTDDVTSLAVVLPKGALARSGRSIEALFLESLTKVNARLETRTRAVELDSKVHTISNYSYSIGKFTGPGFLCVGDSHRFFDPIFSFGVLIALQEAKLAACALDQSLDDKAQPDQFDNFVEASVRAQEIVEYIIRTFWEYPFAFLRLAHFTHKADIAELFSGRLYTPEVMNLEAVGLMRDMLQRTGQIAR